MTETMNREPQIPQEWLNENPREKFARRFSWLIEALPEKTDTVMGMIRNEDETMSLFTFFTSDNPNAERYAHMLGVSLAALSSSEFVAKERLLASGEDKNS